MKYANALVVEPELDRQHWDHIHGLTRAASNSKIAASGIDLRRYLLTHATIIASVMTEPGEDWLIKPECSFMVNNNNDAWTNGVLKLSYKTFQGAFNFLEHYQNSKASKGYIVDAILRKIDLGDSGVWVYYGDILVATDLKHKQLVADIQSKKIRYLSMGCVTDMITCSYCGAHNGGEGVACSHLANSKGRFLSDRDGIPRRVCELCGHVSLPGGGVKFVEASWVAQPAFPGATTRSEISASWEAPEQKIASLILPTEGIQKVASRKEIELLNPTDRQERIAQAEMRRLR